MTNPLDPLLPFTGAKIALLLDQHILAYRRDDKPGIPHPGQWDLPGGGREGNETPFQCVQREVHEEFGIHIAAAAVRWTRRYPPLRTGGLPAYFMGGRLSPDAHAAIRFGDEGQEWTLMPVDEFLSRSDAVAHLQQRLADFLASPQAAG